MITKFDLLEHWTHGPLQLESSLLKAFEKIPRELFVAEEFHEQAYEDKPLPTLREQSISQPTTIMIMLKALNLKSGMKIFEVGSGVGYQASLIAKIIGAEGKLITSEVIPELVQRARHNLQKLGFSNTTVLESNGGEGFPQEAPYDRIVLTAACPSLPEPLINQLKDGGIILAPIGDIESQTLVKGVKRGQGIDLEFLGSFSFVPMKGKYGFHGYREKGLQ